MIHFGDITQLSGHTLPIVDVIVGGSPCQDLSVAGKREGLAGARSGLFMEQVRLVKEMRERDRLENGRPGYLCRPRFMVWENVPGAFSSNGGKDFQAVLEEIVGIVEASVPDLRETVTSAWTKSGCLYDEMGAWSVAWRVHDAQFWGVPQRRKRIALVADFGGLAAPEILFERKGLHWHSEPSGEAGQGTAAGTESGADRTICLQGNGIDRADTARCNGAGWRRGGSYALNTIDRHAVATRDTPETRTTFGVGEPDDPQFTISAAHEHAVFSAGFSFGQSAQARSLGYHEEMAPTLKGGEGGNQKPVVLQANE